MLVQSVDVMVLIDAHIDKCFHGSRLTEVRTNLVSGSSFYPDFLLELLISNFSSRISFSSSV